MENRLETMTPIAKLSQDVGAYIARHPKKWNSRVKHIHMWCSSKSEMNGATPKTIRNVLAKSLMELGVRDMHVSVVLSAFYSNLRDFDSSHFISQVYRNARSIYVDEIILDVLYSKNEHIASAARTSFLLTFLETSSKFHIRDMSTSEIVGLCLFAQCVLMGARSGRTGFGTADDLVQFEKDKYTRRMNRIATQRAREYAKQESALRYRRMMCVDDEEDEEDEKDEKDAEDLVSDKEVVVPISSEDVDDWESLV